MNINTFQQKRFNEFGLSGNSKLLPFNYVPNGIVGDYAELYNGRSQEVDAYLLSKYGKVKIDDSFDVDIIKATNMYTNIFNGFIVLNNDRLDRIWKAYTSEYDIFENFNTTRTIKTTNGERVNTNVFGEKNIQENFGVDKQTIVNGAVNSTDTIGEVNSTDTIGATNEKTIHNVNGYDTGIAEQFNDVNTNDEHINKNNISEHINTNLTNEHTDIITNDAKQNVTTNSSYTDTFTTNSFIDEVVETFKGNQGVSITNQVLVKNEIVLRLSFEFYENMFNMFLPYVSGGVWSDY